jgi:hypothetical protein
LNDTVVILKPLTWWSATIVVQMPSKAVAVVVVHWQGRKDSDEKWLGRIHSRHGEDEAANDMDGQSGTRLDRPSEPSGPG